MILRNSGLWRLKWLWSGCEVTSQGLSVASRGSEPLYLEKKKNSTSVYEEVSVTTQMGHPSILPLELVPPRLIPVWCGVRRTVFLSASVNHMFYSQPCARLTAGRGQGKAGMTMVFRDLSCLWLHPRNATCNIMNLCGFFLQRLPTGSWRHQKPQK